MTNHVICVYRITDKPPVCEICGKPAEQADAPALTVGDMVKRLEIGIRYKHYVLHFTEARWEIWRTNSIAKVFSSPDESAACAEFLRLTGGES